MMRAVIAALSVLGARLAPEMAFARTARALVIDIAPAILARADEVIE